MKKWFPVESLLIWWLITIVVLALLSSYIGDKLSLSGVLCIFLIVGIIILNVKLNKLLEKKEK